MTTPSFPALIPDRVSSRSFIYFQDENIKSEEDVQNIILDIYEHPEIEFYYFRESHKGLNKFLSAAQQANSILLNDFDNFYYRHPRYPKDFVRIQRNQIEFEWQREVVEKSPSFARHRIFLSKAQERYLATIQAIHIEKQINSNPIELKPGFMGFSVDMLKPWHLIKRIINNKTETGGTLW